MKSPGPYILLICGIVLLGVAIFLLVTNQSADGITFPGRGGTGGGQPISFGGGFVLILGLVLSILAIYSIYSKDDR